MLENDIPQGTYFISHAYAQADIVEHLKTQLPSHIKPFIFPKIEAQPDQLITDTLIENILACDGLIYLAGGESSESFWVVFEKDYAKRAGKPVYCYSIEDDTLSVDERHPPDLDVFPYYIKADLEKVKQVATIMRNKRFFDILQVYEEVSEDHQDYTQRMAYGVASVVRNGGYVVAFWSTQMARQYRLGIKRLRRREQIEKVLGVPGRIWTRFSQRFASPPQIEQNRVVGKMRSALTTPAQKTEQSSGKPHILLIRLEETPLPSEFIEAELITIDLYDNDNQLSFINKIDSLIVQLYWLFYQALDQPYSRFYAASPWRGDLEDFTPMG